MTLKDFLTQKEETDIWDLKYISTSDEEDNDSDMASEGESEDSENSDSDELKAKEKQVTLEGGDNLPQMFKQFKRTVGTKKQARVQYEYRYSNDPDSQQVKPRKTVVVRKRADRKGP